MSLAGFRTINIVHVELICVALGKRLLLDPGVKAGDRLRVLERMHEYVRPGGLTPEMLELVDPASDTEMSMFMAARSLDPDPWPADNYSVPAFIGVLSESIEHFAELNSGIRAAIERRRPAECKARDED
jgi:hypothetical protein